MAVIQKTVSDISGKELEDESAAKLVVSDHPALGGRTVELDVDASEIEKLESSKLTMVSVAVYTQGRSSPQRIILDAAAFDKLFPPGTVEEVLLNARSGGAEVPRRRGRPRGTATGARSSGGEKTDYTSPEHAGELHRGRVTDVEAAWVRENLDAASANRERAGQPVIDPGDAKEKKRYGL